MSVRMTRGRPGSRSGYDQTKPLFATRKSKPSDSISTTWGSDSATLRTSSASTMTDTLTAHRYPLGGEPFAAPGSPRAQRAQCLVERPPVLGERVLHPRRHLAEDLAVDQPVLLHFAQVLDEHLLADAGQPAAKFAEAARAVAVE